LTTGSDNNAGARARASSISYCHDGPLRWSPDPRAGHAVVEGSAGTSPAVAASGDAPWWCTGPIRRFGLGRRRSGSGTVLAAPPGGAGLDARPAVPAMTGGRAGTRCGGRGGSLRGTAGNGRERLGPSLGRCPSISRTIAPTLPSISRSIDWACRPRPHSPGQLAPGSRGGRCGGVGTGTGTAAVGGRDLGVVGRAADALICRGRGPRRRLAGRVGGAERPPCRRGPTSTARATSQVLSLLRSSPPGAACHARPEDAGKRADVLPALGLPTP
jgi:hypothetical protein